MAINISQIKDLLLPGLKGFTGKYDQIPRQYDKVFDKTTSNKSFERYVELEFLGYAQKVNEGAATPFSNSAGQRAVYNLENFEVRNGFAITEKTIEDNQYKSEFGPSVMGLNESFAQTKEVFAAAILNAATTYDSNIGGDLVALCSTAHPIKDGTVANKPSVELDLNEASLAQAMTAVRTDFRDRAGLKVMSRAKKLIVSPQREAVAIRLTKSEYRPGTGNNDVNALLSLSGGLTEGFLVMDFLTSPYAWFLKTNIRGLIYQERVAYKTDMQTDFSTNNLLTKARERYAFGYKDWRAIWGSFPTN